ELRFALWAVELAMLPGAHLLKQHAVILARPLILARLLEVMNLVTKAVLLIAHVTLTTTERPLCHILDYFTGSRVFHRLVKLRAEIDSHLLRALLGPQAHISRVTVEGFVAGPARIEPV